jgi:hypothetical protein
MQAPVWATRIVGWRWTPAFALVAGSLVFVGVVVAVVPEDLGAVGSGAERLSRATRSRVGTNAEATLGANADSTFEATPSGDDDSVRAARVGRGHAVIPASPGNVVQSIFHAAPKVELPVEPVDPTPQPPPPPPPPPPPTATIYTLENPPPPPPNPLAVPAPPSEPQGITGQ